jgi:hypothetical protein
MLQQKAGQGSPSIEVAQIPVVLSTLSRILVASLPFVSVVIFGALAFHQYRLPGLYYDEAFDVVPAMQLLNGQEVQLARGVGIHLFGRSFPVMIGDYWGVVSTYAVLPLFAIFGVGVFPIRLWTISAGMAAVFLTFVVGRKLYRYEVGALASLLLAIFPSFVFWTRTGIYVISHIVAVVLGIILAFLRWRETGRRRWLFIATLLTGIGLSTKLLFLWFLIAVPGAYFLLLIADWLSVHRQGRSAGRRVVQVVWQRFRIDVPLRGTYDLAAAFLGFLLGAFPVVYYNLVSQGSYLVLRANLFQTERGVNNFALWENVKTELDSLRVLLDGGYFWYYGGIYTNPLYPWIAGASTIGTLVLVHACADHRRFRRQTVFLLGFALVTFFLSCFSVSILGPTHLLILLPIPQLMISAFAVLGLSWMVKRLPAATLAPVTGLVVIFGALLGPLIARDLWVDRQYHATLSRGGGQSSFSSAIYTMAQRLDDAGIEHPYALDWGFKYPIMILTEGRVEPLEIFGSSYEPGPDFEAALREALEEPTPVFISHDEEASAFPRLNAFRRIVADSGRQIVRQETIQQLDGKRVFYIFHIQ